MSESNTQSLPQGWTVAPLTEIADVNPGTNRNIDNDSIQVNFVPMRAVEPDGGGLSSPEVRPYGEVKKGYTSFLSGDVIMAKITPCMENGKTAVVPDLPHELCFGSTEFHVIRPADGVQPKWIANFLLQHEVRRAAQRQMTGGVGQMRVPASFLQMLQIPVAPVAEQQRIAETLDELLSDLDAGVAALQSAKAKLALYRASVLKAAVQGDLTAKWREQHPDAEPASALLQCILTERRQRWEQDQLRKFKAAAKTPPANWKAKYKQPVAPDITNLAPLPKGWCWASLDQVADIAGGVTKGQKFSDGADTEIVPYLRVANVQRGFLDLSEIKRIRATQRDIQELALRPNDVLFNEGGDRDKLGRGWIWEGQIDRCIHQNHVFRARLYSEEIDAKLVSHCGNSYGREWFMRTGKQSVNLASINMTVLRSFPVPVMPVSEQKTLMESLDDQLSVLDHLALDLVKRIELSGTLRQAVLRSAFTGELAPQIPTDEPASELLKRIATERENAQKQKPVRESVRRAENRNEKANGRIANWKTGLELCRCVAGRGAELF